MSTPHIRDQITRRILVLDGATGTMIQQYKLPEEAFRGKRFSGWKIPLKGNNDLLNLTLPHVISEIHQSYLEAGAHIITTNTFNANAISMKDYGLEHLVGEINERAALLACQRRDRFMQNNPGAGPRFVAGSLGPTGKMTSMSPKVEDPAFRDMDFRRLCEVYLEQVTGLMAGGVDLLLLETITDVLNAKAALFAIMEYEETHGVNIPTIASGTISDASGRILSGHSMEAFVTALGHKDLLALGLNCAFGARQMKPHLVRLSAYSPFPVSLHPNAGLPNQLGGYDQSPEAMAEEMEEYMEAGLVNLVGGCCGTTPSHIRLLAESAAKYRPRILPSTSGKGAFGGWDNFVPGNHQTVVAIGERTNVAGSKKFARLIREGNFEKAVEIARIQVENGAQLIDVCMDDAMIDGRHSMEHYLRMLACEPEVAGIPWMIDSSHWDVVESGLMSTPGKPIVNSISLKDGEIRFLEKARRIRKLGAGVVVMLFDEHGQADNYRKRVQMARRVYELLTVQAGFPAENIIIDPNILAIGTGIAAHNNQAVDFLKACRWIKTHLPGVLISGGVSNLSFSFRGHHLIRKAMHAVFLHHAKAWGMDMAIIQPDHLQVYDAIPEHLRRAAEDLVLNRRPDATERMLAYATDEGHAGDGGQGKKQPDREWRKMSAADRLCQGLIRGEERFIATDVRENLQEGMQPLAVVEGPLMKAMDEIGSRFGRGEIFLPQVIKSARVMQKAVHQLAPFMEKGENNAAHSRGKILLATVKGDVHDIGKNILSLILSCNGYQVVDLGVMVPVDKILDTAQKEKVEMIGVSGLISPSLEEMIQLARAMEKRKMDIPLLVGGAATGALHTAVHIAPEYSGGVIHVRDASTAPGVIGQLTGNARKVYIMEVGRHQQKIRDTHDKTTGNKQWVSLQKARENPLITNWEQTFIPAPRQQGLHIMNNIPLDHIIPYIDWGAFLHAWDLRGKYPRMLGSGEKGKSGRALLKDARQLLQSLKLEEALSPKGVAGLFPAYGLDDDVMVCPDGETPVQINFLRNQESRLPGGNICLADFVAPESYKSMGYVGCFVLSIHGAHSQAETYCKSTDDYMALMVKVLADCLAEGFSSYMHKRVAEHLWGYAKAEGAPRVGQKLREEVPNLRGIRPAVGYSSCPDHSQKQQIFHLLDATRHTGVTTTENYAMLPGASVAGWYFAHPEARYFHLGKIGQDQVTDYARRRNISFEQSERLLSAQLAYMR